MAEAYLWRRRTRPPCHPACPRWCKGCWGPTQSSVCCGRGWRWWACEAAGSGSGWRWETLWGGGGKKKYKIRRVFKKSLKPKQKATQIFTWHYFTAHGDRLEGFPRGLGRARRLTLRDDFTARRDRLEGRVAVGTQRDPVTSLRTCWRALPRSPAAVGGPPRLHFYGYWRGGRWETRFKLSPLRFHCCGNFAYLCLRQRRACCGQWSVRHSGRGPRRGWPLSASAWRKRWEECSRPRECPGEALRPPPGRKEGGSESQKRLWKTRSSIITYSLCSERLQPRVRSVQLWDEEKKKICCFAAVS